MIRNWLLQLGTLGISIVSGFAHANADFLPAPLSSGILSNSPYNMVGMVVIYKSGGYYGCSGAAVRNPKLVLSAAHCVYDSQANRDPWATTASWARTHHSGDFPFPPYEGQVLRGHYYLTEYATDRALLTDNDYRTFDDDIAVHYAYEDVAGGDYAPNFDDGLTALQSGAAKTIVGYPSLAYTAPDSHQYMMHETGPFSNPFTVYSSYHGDPLERYTEIDGVASIGGNSGAPLFVYDSSSSQYKVAGVVVGGLSTVVGHNENLAAVVAMDAETWALVDQAGARATSGWGPGEGPNLSITGNGAQIRNGDSAPRSRDYTYFGTTRRSSQTLTRSFAIKNIGTAQLNLLSAAQLSGSKNFRIVTRPENILAVDDATTVRVRFQSKKKGTFKAVLRISSDDGDTPVYQFTIQAKRR